jgi:hypothetical protein
MVATCGRGCAGRAEGEKAMDAFVDSSPLLGDMPALRARMEEE